MVKSRFLILCLFLFNFIFAQSNSISYIYISDTSSKENIYETVNINGIYWSRIDLNLIKFKNGDSIKQAKDLQDWNSAYQQKEPVWMYHKDNSLNGAKYGKLYNYYAVIDKRGLAPDGYHIPSKNEFESISNLSSIGLKSTDEWYVRKYKSKTLKNIERVDRNGLPYLDLAFVETDFQQGEYGNNNTGFNARPCGRIDQYGHFDFVGKEAVYWTITSAGDLNSSAFEDAQYVFKIAWNENKPSLIKAVSSQGFYVRCIYGKSKVEIELEKKIIKNREDSIRLIIIKQEERQRKINDSINKISFRIRDSIKAIRLIEQQIINQILAKERDSMLEIENKIIAKRERKSVINKKARLNYWGFGMSINNIQKDQNLLNNNAWKIVTDPKYTVNGKKLDGSGIGYNFLISQRLLKFLGIEFLLSSNRDGKYKDVSKRSVYYSDTPTYALLKNAFYGIGPILTIPISSVNLDFKYIYNYSTGSFSDPTNISDIKKYKTSTSGSIVGAGIRIPIGKGENTLKEKISRGYIGFYYELYKFDYKYPFGTLPAYNTSFSMRYINTVN